MALGVKQQGREAAQEVREQARRPWVERVLRVGWMAKGLVYVLMGWVALSFTGTTASRDDKASPEGALGVVADRSGGPLLLFVLGVGLVLYALWRVVTVFDVRGGGAKHHIERVAFAFSALFYGFLAFTAFRNAKSGTRPDDSLTVERMSRSLLGHRWGRVVMLVAAAVVLVVAVVFAWRVVAKKFTEGIDGLAPSFGANHGWSKVLWVLGAAGWLGRAVVVGLIGVFLWRSAVDYDPNEASGFDLALRRTAQAGSGRTLVTVAAVGLILYGIYCAASAPRRDVDEKSA